MAGSPPTLYRDHAGTSWPKPAPVREAIQSALEAPVDAWAETFARHHERVADAFAISDPQCPRSAAKDRRRRALSVESQDAEPTEPPPPDRGLPRRRRLWA